MRCVDERMQRRVDRRNRAALAELAVGVHVDDVVLVDPARMNPFERQDEIEIEQRQATVRQRPEVASGTLDGEHASLLTRDRVRQRELGGRIAAGEVGHALVGAEPVGTADEVDDGLMHAARSTLPRRVT